jgi:hypothetical protein
MSIKKENASVLITRLMSESVIHQRMIMQAVEEYLNKISLIPADAISENERAFKSGVFLIVPDGEMWKITAAQIQHLLSEWYVKFDMPDDDDEDTEEMMNAD